MVDDVLLNKVVTIERCLQRVEEEYVGFEDLVETNYTRQDSIILNIQRACEAALDMAAHVVRVKQLGVPQTSREVFALLAGHNVIPDELSETLQKMVGFRNISVHDYTKLNLAIIRKIITVHLKDLQEFVSLTNSMAEEFLADNRQSA